MLILIDLSDPLYRGVMRSVMRRVREGYADHGLVLLQITAPNEEMADIKLFVLAKQGSAELDYWADVVASNPDEHLNWTTHIDLPTAGDFDPAPFTRFRAWGRLKL